eukprot:CAMPEP_0203814776 /NCGR_PEP_ID=MMETSP0115-20131106/5480_1 /ASSEMBLY_ACC=CAM_ASM_000227 /TAXON_ID=33651 /ORGANISM="Bicosoecid sp, Strain ms1" /LENGTH=47 /DNA_ID= /DNA_START= /DNA_END= /DNA_ORIENTATION=
MARTTKVRRTGVGDCNLRALNRGAPACEASWRAGKRTFKDGVKDALL